jgi:hypothetical protein
MKMGIERSLKVIMLDPPPPPPFTKATETVHMIYVKYLWKAAVTPAAEFKHDQ